MADLKTNLLGFAMNSPIIGASGTVGYGVEYEELADFSKIGGISGKGLTLHGQYGNKGERLWEAHRTHFYQRALTNGFDVGQVIGRVVLTNVVLLLLAAATVAVPDPIVAGLALAAGIAVVTFVLAQFSRPRPPRDLPHRVR